MHARTRCSAACVVETDRRRSEKNGNAGMYVTYVRTVVNVIYAMLVTYVMAAFRCDMHEIIVCVYIYIVPCGRLERRSMIMDWCRMCSVYAPMYVCIYIYDTAQG